MSAFSGRRPTGNASRIGKGFLEGLSALGTALADSPKRARIVAIDEMINNLQQERDHLVVSLIEPGDLKVSEAYDPHWRMPEETTTTRVTSTGGRLVECRGRSWAGDNHKAHPGCPYPDQHIAHEFTLND